MKKLILVYVMACSIFLIAQNDLDPLPLRSDGEAQAVNDLYQQLEEAKFLTGNLVGSVNYLWLVPHYYEFEISENPNRYWWCGHAALKCAAKFKSGTLKTLDSIHDTFKKNSPNGYAKNPRGNWSAKLQDLYWAAKLSQNGGYGRGDSVVRSVYNSGQFLQKIKDGVDNNFPSIIASKWRVPVGHFYVIVGYLDNGTPDNSYVYVRDVLEPNPLWSWYDHKVKVQDLWNDSHEGNYLQILYIK